jgi:hypothetical protein
MRLPRSLVLVVHGDPDVRAGQANDLSQAGFRCLVAGDPAAGLWFALKFALELVPSVYGGVILVTPEPPPAHEVPDSIVCVTSAQGAELVEAVRHATQTQQVRFTRTLTLVSRPPAPDYVSAGTDSIRTTGAAACS